MRFRCKNNCSFLLSIKQKNCQVTKLCDHCHRFKVTYASATGLLVPLITWTRNAYDVVFCQLVSENADITTCFPEIYTQFTIILFQPVCIRKHLVVCSPPSFLVAYPCELSFIDNEPRTSSCGRNRTNSCYFSLFIPVTKYKRFYFGQDSKMDWSNFHPPNDSSWDIG